MKSGTLFLMMRYFEATARAFPHLFMPAPLSEDGSLDKAQIRSDVFAGITVAVVLIPQAMAYALLLGLSPINGLYAAFFGVLVASLWGSSRQMVTGPVGVMSLLSLSALAPYAGEGPERMITLAAALAFMVGVSQLVLGVFRLGFVMRLVPHSVLIGFSTGAALVIALTQIPAFLGVSVGAHEFVFQTMHALVLAAADAKPATLIVGLASLAGVVLLRRLGKAFPGALIVMILATAASWLLGLESSGVSVIGTIPQALPSFHAIGFGDILALGPQAAVLALIGFMESFAIAKALASEKKQKIDVDKELVGQGLANATAGLFQGYPVSGSFSISALNVSAGARTALSGVTTAICIVAAIFILTPLLYFLPKATLAAIILSAVVRLVSLERIRHLYAVAPADGIVAAITGACAVLVKPDDAVFLGVIVALLVFIWSVMQVEVVELGMHRAWHTLRSLAHNEDIDIYPHVLIIRVDRAFVYANAERIVEETYARIAEREARTHEKLRALVMNCSGVNGIDGSGLEGFEEIADTCAARGMQVALLNVKHGVRDALKRARLDSRIDCLHNYDELDSFRRRFAGDEITPTR